MKHFALIFTILTISLTAHTQLPTYLSSNGLVGYWPFNGNANDESGNSLNGTVNGATLTLDRSSNPNAAYSFNGTNSYISVAHHSLLNFASNNTISVVLWIYPTAYPGNSGDNQVFVSKQDGDGTTQVGFNCWHNSIFASIRTRNGSGDNFGGVNSSNALLLNQWTHIAMIYDNNIGQFYMNGILVTTSGNQPSTVGDNTMSLLFGMANWVNSNAPAFQGALDDICIYNRAISLCDVVAIYNESTFSATAIPSNPSSICQGDSLVLQASLGSTYQWLLNNSPVAGAIAVNYSANQAGNYSVIVTDSNGCIDTSNTIGVVVNPLPPIPMIIQNGNDLTSSSVYGNQWYMNGNSIVGAIGQTFSPTQNGLYSVCATDSNGCTACSVPLDYTFVSVSVSLGRAFLLLPNPATDHVVLEFMGETVDGVMLELRDYSGRLVSAMRLVQSEMVLDLSGLASGVYLVVLRSEGGTSGRRLMVKH